MERLLRVSLQAVARPAVVPEPERERAPPVLSVLQRRQHVGAGGQPGLSGPDRRVPAVAEVGTGGKKEGRRRGGGRRKQSKEEKGRRECCDAAASELILASVLTLCCRLPAREAEGLRSRAGSREDHRRHRFHRRTHVPHEMVGSPGRNGARLSSLVGT